MTHPSLQTRGANVLSTILTLCGPGTALLEAQERAWASATFAGARHVIDLTLALPDADADDPAVLAALPEHDFALRGEIVADCSVVRGPRHRTPAGWCMDARIELLTIDAD